MAICYLKNQKNAKGLKDKFRVFVLFFYVFFFSVLTTPRLEDIPNFLWLNELILFPTSATDLCIYFTDGEIRML